MTQPPGSPYPPSEPEYPQPEYPQQPVYQPGPPPPPPPVYQPPPPGYPPQPEQPTYQQPGYQPPPPGYPPQQPPGYPPPVDPYAAPGYAAPPPPGYPNYPTSAQPYPTSGMPYQPSGPPDPYAMGPYGAPPPLKKKRTGLIVTLIVVALVVLCGGGGTTAWLVTRNNSNGTGQSSPTAAVTGFLTAVYQDQDITKASTYVCSQARDKTKLTKKINEIKQQSAKYDTPKYEWTDPKVESSKADEATLSTTVTLSTANEQTATQKLTFVATKNNGWWVCEVKAS